MIESFGIDYQRLLDESGTADGERLVGYLLRELPGLFFQRYLRMTDRVTNVCRYFVNDFEYIYDDYASLEAKGIVEAGTMIESRVVAVVGRSRPVGTRRDQSRQQGWVGQTERFFGADIDKGHFMAHSIGGGLEVNVFAQRRDFNRGWSARGKVFREMERYCATHTGTFCFNRPIYADESSRPALIEFGLLKESGELWVELFEN